MPLWSKDGRQDLDKSTSNPAFVGNHLPLRRGAVDGSSLHPPRQKNIQREHAFLLLLGCYREGCLSGGVVELEIGIVRMCREPPPGEGLTQVPLASRVLC